MESNIIRWLNNSNDTILDSILRISRNSYFISKPNLIEFASRNSSYYKRIRKGLSYEEFEMLRKQILNVLPSYYLNNNSNDNEIFYSYNHGKDNNLKFESSIRQLIENNLILNQNHFVKINNNNNINNNYNNNNNNDKDLINSINNNNYNPNNNNDSITIDLSKLQQIQNDSKDSNAGKCVIKNNNPNELNVIELVPNNHKEYFNKNIPLEISKLMDAKEYHSFISRLNNTYSGNLFITLYIIFYVVSIIIIGTIGFMTMSEEGIFIHCIIFSAITVVFFVFFIVYCFKIKYYLISKIIRKKNLKLLRNNSPLEFVLVYKQVKYPQTNDRMTLQILIIKPDYAGINNNNQINNNNEEKDELREDIINETINNNLNKLNHVDNV